MFIHKQLPWGSKIKVWNCFHKPSIFHHSFKNTVREYVCVQTTPVSVIQQWTAVALVKELQGCPASGCCIWCLHFGRRSVHLLQGEVMQRTNTMQHSGNWGIMIHNLQLWKAQDTSKPKYFTSREHRLCRAQPVSATGRCSPVWRAQYTCAEAAGDKHAGYSSQQLSRGQSLYWQWVQRCWLGETCSVQSPIGHTQLLHNMSQVSSKLAALGGSVIHFEWLSSCQYMISMYA